MRFPRSPSPLAVVGALCVTATGFLVNILSSPIEVRSPVGLVTVAFAALLLTIAGVVATGGTSLGHAVSESVDDAAVKLHGLLRAQWLEDLNWRRTSESDRLAIQWRISRSAIFSSNGIEWLQRPTRLTGRDLASLWTASSTPSRLVVLGMGGSGKTELLMSTAQALLARWRPGEAVPILVPLNEWTPDRDLRSWLIGWIGTTYNLPAPACEA